MTYLTEEQAQQIEEALDTAYGLAESDWTEHKYAAALAIIRAARAQEQAEQEPVAYMFKVKRTLPSSTPLDVFAAIEYHPLPHEDIISKAPLYAAPIEPIKQEPVAKAIHYPECWDTAAYPTLESALNQLAACFKCDNDECAAPVRTKDLTREEIGKVSAAYGQHSIKGFDHILSFARAVIAADREKNK